MAYCEAKSTVLRRKPVFCKSQVGPLQLCDPGRREERAIVIKARVTRVTPPMTVIKVRMIVITTTLIVIKARMTVITTPMTVVKVRMIVITATLIVIKVRVTVITTPVTVVKVVSPYHRDFEGDFWGVVSR